jgi:hypothetical protein
MPSLRLAGLIPLILTAHGAILFEDNFDRADSRNIDASLTGITDNTGTPLLADAVYSQPWLDPNNAAPIYGVQDGNAANGGGSQILAGVFQVKVGTGTANAYINHNFTNAAILSAGGFSVAMDVTGYNQATVNQGAVFGIGMTAAEAASMRDAVANGISEPHLSNAFGTGLAGQTNAVADFWYAIRGNNTVAWGSRDTILGTATVPGKVGQLAANFTVPDFNAGTSVGFELLHNGVAVGSGSYTWTDTNANYLAIDGRDNTFVGVDNLRIATDFVEPVVFPPLVDAFAVTRLQGANDTRFHWRVEEGTLGDPVTITIKNGATVLHTTSSLSGYADVNAAGASDFTITATNTNGSDMIAATIAAENAFSNAVRSDAPAAWYRFNESLASPLIADSSGSAVPHDGTSIGLAITGGPGALDGAANFGGTGSYLTDFILDPATTTSGHTVEAIVRRYPGSGVNAAIASQLDGTGIGRSHLAVDTNGTLQTFLAGGPDERKDSDGKLPADNWAHLTMVVDKVTPEIRWYIDGVLIDTTADGVNPDGSTYNPAFTLEAADGAWRIGTQKGANSNFWLGDMDEVVIYDKLLDDPDGNGNRADSRVAAHAGAWFAAGSGLFGIAAAAETIDEGEGTVLTIRVGADVTSVSVDQGIGTVVPVDGVVTIPVNPATTTTYTVTVESPAGTQVQSVTVTVVEVPEAPPVITSAEISGANFVIQFSGAPDTTYYIRSSSSVDGFPTDLGTTTTDGSGTGSATVPLVPNTPRHFYRLQDTP